MNQRIHLLLLLVCASLLAKAQGVLRAADPAPLTFSSGAYPEHHEKDSMIRIGMNVYNTVTGRAYRMGCEGQKNHDALHGAAGTHRHCDQDAHAPRVGRFLCIDPLVSKYPYWSPYAFSGNRVIDMIELEGLEPTTPVSTWNVQDLGDKYGTGGTVLMVSDAGSDVAWEVVRYQSETHGALWSYKDPSKPRGSRWSTTWQPTGRNEALPAAQFGTCYQDNADNEAAMRALGRRDAARGGAFSDAFAKGMLGLALVGTGGSAAGELLAGSTVLEGLGAAARISANRLFQGTLMERAASGSVNAGGQFLLNRGEFDFLGLSTSVATGNPFAGAALGSFGTLTTSGFHTNDGGTMMTQAVVGSLTGRLSREFEWAWKSLGDFVPTNGTAAMQTLTTWGFFIGGEKGSAALAPEQK
ncbi:MAG TPA: hypothetical protein PKE21_17250 [Flavobacteriales bacterium]|nr:hypothetical protein [Flavobacteriales bacterium]HMR29227.1 hypothetical protein [Flavobacteriales bacterium]